MRLTGEGGVVVEGRYPHGQSGRAIVRRDLDWMLLQQAMAAGCELESGVAVRGAIVEERRGVRTVGGVTVGVNGGARSIPARVTRPSPSVSASRATPRVRGAGRSAGTSTGSDPSG